MLYIRGHKIIKGYIGNTPISHVGFGKSGLIKIKSENGGSDYPDNLIAKYTTNTSGVLPVFNDGYQYTVNETEANGIYTVEISSDSDFTSCTFSGKTQLFIRLIGKRPPFPRWAFPKGNKRREIEKENVMCGERILSFCKNSI